MTADVGKYFKNSIALILVKTLSLYDVPVKSKHFVFLDMGVAKKGCGTQNGNCITSQKSLLWCYLVISGVRSFLARLATTSTLYPVRHPTNYPVAIWLSLLGNS